MPGQPNKGSPKAVAGGYLQPGGPHTNMLGHPAQGPGAPLSHPAAAGPGGLGSAMLNYSNTMPLSHYDVATQGPPRGPARVQGQNKAVMLSLIRQQQQQMKQKQGLPFRPHLPHGQVRLQLVLYNAPWPLSQEFSFFKHFCLTSFDTMVLA